MELLFNRIFLNHDTGMHPENRKRLEHFEQTEETEVPDGSPYLELIHTKEYIDKVKMACRQSAHLDADTVTSPGSFEAACKAVGATIMASEQNDFALVRPPGHHAYPFRASGFCLFNNIAIATQKLADEGKRMLIFDFDGHLGDGTSEIFYETDQVMYWSIHQYPAFPGHGFVDEIGRGKGKGFTVNVPLPPGSGDDIFMNAVDNLFPVAKQFQPDIVAVSAGFDAHAYDLLLDLRVTAGSFYQIGVLLRENFDRVFATLEGGYNIEELYRCVENFRNGVNGQDMPFQEKPTESSRRVWEEYENRLHSLMSNLSGYWKI
jgi:acetoin utilization deacetylase AcuC-like enzyme